MTSNINEQELWEQIALKKQNISTLKETISGYRKDISSNKKLVNQLLSEIETARIADQPLTDENAKWDHIYTLKTQIDTLVSSIRTIRDIIKEKENTVDTNIDLLQDNALEGVSLPPPKEKILNIPRLVVTNNTFIEGTLNVSSNTNLKNLNVSGNLVVDNSINLIDLLVSNNANLTDLLVSNNANFNKLFVDNSTNLTDLNVSNNANFNKLVVDNSTNLTDLNVSNNANFNKLVVDNSANLTDLNVSNNANLNKLVVDNSANLTDLNVSNNANLTNLNVTNSFNLANKFVLDNSNNIIVKTNIIPDASNVYTLGTIDKPFMDLFLGPSSLYINGTKVISADKTEEMKIETTIDQNLTIQTTGTGIMKFQSTADMNFNTIGLNSDINMTTSGGLKLNSPAGLIFETGKYIKYADNQIQLKGDVLVDGSLNITGKQIIINTETVTIKDNLIELNSNQVNNPPTTLESGIIVNRGVQEPYKFIFKEDTDTFNVGISGDLQPVATRKESNLMTDLGIIYWDNSNNRLDTFNNVKYNNNNLNLVNGSKLLISGVDVLANIDSSLNNLSNEINNNIIGGASTIISDNLTPSRVLISDVSGKVAVSSVTSTELGYLSGVTSNIQSQLDSFGNINDTSANFSNLTVTGITELNNLDVSGDINLKGIIYKDNNVYLDPNKYRYVDKFEYYYSGIYNDFSFNMYLSDNQNNFTHYTILKDTIIDNLFIHQIGEPEVEYNVNILIERDSSNINNNFVIELDTVSNGKQLGYYNTPPPVDNLALWVPFERDSTNLGTNQDYQVLGASISKGLGKFGSNCATYGISSGISTTEIDPTPNNWTFCFWYKFMQGNSILSGGDHKFFVYMKNISESNYINGNFGISILVVSVYFWLRDGSSTVSIAVPVVNNTSELLDWAQEWHNFVVSKDGNTIKVYIDGILKGSRTSSNLVWYIAPLQFGTVPHYYKAHDSSGKVDDIRWYTRTLSDTEIGYFNTITVNNTESLKLVPVNIPIYKNDKIKVVINRTNKYLDKGVENVKLLLYTTGEQHNIVSINKPYLFLYHRVSLNNTTLDINTVISIYTLISGFSIGEHYNITAFNDGFIVKETGIYKIRCDYYEINGGNEGFYYTISDSSTNIINDNVIMSKTSTGDGLQWVMNLEKDIKYGLYVRPGNTRTLNFREISLYVEKIQDTFSYKEWNTNDTSIYNVDKNVAIGKDSGNYELDVSGDINLTGNLLQNGSNYNPIINSVDTLERQYNITLEDMFKTLFSNYLPINNLYSAFTTFVPIYSAPSNGYIFLSDSNLPSFVEIDYELKPEYGYGFKIQFYIGGGGDYRSIALTDFLIPNKRLSLRVECLGSANNLFVSGRTINSGTYLDMWNNSNSITISSSTRNAVALNLVSTTNREFRSIGGSISTYFNVLKIRGFR